MSASKEEVASSNKMILLFFNIALAIDSLCFSPPDSLTPFSPIIVSNLFGNLFINSSANAQFARAAFSQPFKIYQENVESIYDFHEFLCEQMAFAQQDGNQMLIEGLSPWVLTLQCVVAAEYRYECKQYWKELSRGLKYSSKFKKIDFPKGFSELIAKK